MREIGAQAMRIADHYGYNSPRGERATKTAVRYQRNGYGSMGINPLATLPKGASERQVAKRVYMGLNGG